MKRGFYFLLPVLSIAVCLIAGEIVSRLFFPPVPINFSERNLMYNFDAELGWIPPPNQSRTFSVTRDTLVTNNSLGLRDHEYGPKNRPRLAILGDSYVWGYDLEQKERFSDLLQTMVPQWEFLNLGVSGYGTDQEFLLFRKFEKILQADAVFLLFNGDNDFDDNSENDRYGGYRKPYFVVENGKPVLKGQPAARTPSYFFKEHKFLLKSSLVTRILYGLLSKMESPRVEVPDPTKEIFRMMRDVFREEKLKFAVGITGKMWSNDAFAAEYDDEKIRNILDDLEIPSVTLETNLNFQEHGHWTAKGNKWAATQIAQYLRPWFENKDTTLKTVASPCTHLVSQCKTAGFTLGGDRKRDFYSKCVYPLITGRSVEGIRSRPEYATECIGAPSAKACKNIITECRSRGFDVGKGSKDLIEKCIKPALAGASIPEVAVSSSDVVQCRQVRLFETEGLLSLLYANQ